MATVNEKMTAIADNIREKTGGAEALTLEQMASGVNEVYQAGKKAEYNEFWDNYQSYGNRVNYRYAFSNAWTPKCFYPKYDIRPTGANGIYMFANNPNFQYTDLEQRLEECGVVLDLSALTSSEKDFYMSRFKRLPLLDFSGCTSMASTFDYCNVNTIRIRLSESGETTFTSVFRRCYDLKIFEVVSGAIGKSISFADSDLYVASMKNIIEHLKNYAGTTSEYTYTVTFKSTAFEALEAEGATAEYNGVACTWAELIDNLKWNLVKA